MRTAEYVLLALAVLMVTSWWLSGKRAEFLASGGLTLAWAGLLISIAVSHGWPGAAANFPAFIMIWAATHYYLRGRRLRRALAEQEAAKEWTLER